MFFKELIRKHREAKRKLEEYREYNLPFWNLADCIYAAMLNVDNLGVKREDFFTNYKHDRVDSDNWLIEEFSFDVDGMLRVQIIATILPDGGDLEWYNKRRKDLGVSTLRLNKVHFFIDKMKMSPTLEDATILTRRVISAIKARAEAFGEKRKNAVSEYIHDFVDDEDKEEQKNG